MRLINMLNHKPVEAATNYQRQKIRPEFKDSERRYRAFMTVPRTVPEVAKHLGYTYAGARASLLRFESRGLVKRTTPKGCRPTKYIWRTK